MSIAAHPDACREGVVDPTVSASTTKYYQRSQTCSGVAQLQCPISGTLYCEGIDDRAE